MVRFAKPKCVPRSFLDAAVSTTILFIVAVFAVGRVSGQDAIPEETLQTLKDATVYVRVEMGEESGSGSGFLIGKQNEFAYILTNEHVVRQSGQTRRVVLVDFYSGTKKRKTTTATVLSEDSSRDLAVLRIRNRDLPKPIELKSSHPIRETESVYILGFPFGEALATSSLGPNVTIGKGTISSIRNDEFGNLDQVQVDGDINPGNSGGPIVFADGSLMGVSVATILGTQIGIGIPGQSVMDMLFGRIGALGISQKPSKPKQVICSLTAELIDPLEKIKNISFLYVDARRVERKDLLPREDGKWHKISESMKEVQLDVDGQKAAGKTTIEGDYGEKVEIIHQVKFVNGRGDTFFTSPGKYAIDIPSRDDKSTRKEAEKEIAEKEADREESDEKGKVAESEMEEEEETKDGWLGSDRKESENSLAVEPKQAGNPLAGQKFKCVDADCQNLDFESTGVLPCMQWDAGHQHFFVLNEQGLLRKISFPELEEVTTVDFASKCTWMQMSKEGLCVLVNGLQDLVVVDPETLKPKRKFAIGEAEKFGASPASSIAFVPANGQLHLFDLKSGKNVRSYSPDDFQSNEGRIHSFDGPTLSPNGKYLICVSMECLHRIRVKDKTLSYEEQGPRIGSNSREVTISDDSKYVALPSGGGNGEGYSTYIYAIEDLKKHVLAAESGAYPQAIGFDKEAGLIYGQNHGTELLTFTGKGLVNKTYDLVRNTGADTTQFLVHPAGYKVIVLTQPKIVVVNLPK